jgi:hypothetical protein
MTLFALAGVLKGKKEKKNKGKGKKKEIEKKRYTLDRKFLYIV